MESNQKSVPVSQTSTNIKSVQPKPTSRGTGRTGSRLTSPNSHHPEQPPADVGNTVGWVQGLPRMFEDVNAGIMGRMMSLVLKYLEEIEVAAVNDRGATSVDEVLQQHKRFRLWKDADSDLDQRLNEDSEMKELVVSALTALVLILRLGIRLCTSESQQTLIKETDRVVEQASNIAHRHLKRSEICPPVTILEFCNSTKTEIKSRIGDLYDLSSPTRRRVQGYGESEPRQVEEIGLGIRRPFLDKNIERVRQSMSRLRSTITSASRSSSASNGAKSSRRPQSNPSNFSTKQSSSSRNSPSRSSLFSHNRTHSLTDTITSNSTRASLSCKKCETTFSELARLQDHVCDTSSMSHYQISQVWHGNNQSYKPCLALLDTGSDDNFILRSVVEELKLDISEKDPIEITSFGHSFKVSMVVEPKWQLAKYPELHEDFPFFVKTRLPRDIDMVVGNVTMRELGIYLQAPRNGLIAYGDRGDLSTLDKERKQHERQARDSAASHARTQRQLEAEYAETVLQKKAAANAATAAEVMQPRNPLSRQNATGSSNDQRR